jgi:hypothetical protein
MNDTPNKTVRDDKQPVREITSLGFLLRFLASLVLVMATYNPTDWSYVDWVTGAFGNGGLGPEHLFVGVVLLIGWAVLLHATFQSLGTLGIILAVAFFGSLVWLLIDFNILATGSVSAWAWIVLVCLAAMLTVGLTWSALWRRMTGQVDVIDDAQ